MPTLCNFSLCLISLVSKSQIMISAGNPGKVFWALAIYFPFGEILIAVLHELYMKFYYRVLSRRFDFWIECAWLRQWILMDRQYANCLDEEVGRHMYALKLYRKYLRSRWQHLFKYLFAWSGKKEWSRFDFEVVIFFIIKRIKNKFESLLGIKFTIIMHGLMLNNDYSKINALSQSLPLHNCTYIDWCIRKQASFNQHLQFAFS